MLHGTGLRTTRGRGAQRHEAEGAVVALAEALERMTGRLTVGLAAAAAEAAAVAAAHSFDTSVILSTHLATVAITPKLIFFTRRGKRERN